MSKRSPISRLGLQSIAAAVIAMAAGVALYFLVTTAVYRMIDSIVMTPQYLARQEQACAGRLQQFITAHDMSISEVRLLDEWETQEKNVLLTLYQEKNVIYYNADVIIGLPESGYEVQNYEGAAEYKVVFRDGIAKAVLICFTDGGFYLFANLLGGLLSMGAALAILYGCIHRKVQYIMLLESELQILKGGDLNCPITIKGNDELTSLAEEMNAMRCAIQERQEEEERAVRANRELVTAMSHDLRTPLTSLLGYVEILSLHKYQEGKEEQYLHVIGEKAHQIKSISDKLFEYFLVFRQEKENMHLQQVNGIEFLGQVVEESLFDMETEGFCVERASDVIDCVLQVDVKSARRVFGNIFSNLIKYADRTQPVQVFYKQQDGNLTVYFRNHTAEGTDKKESNQIGFKTCEKIMENHGGRFRYQNANRIFEVWVEFNILKKT